MAPRPPGRTGGPEPPPLLSTTAGGTANFVVPSPGTGLLEVASGGGVGVFGDARYFGSMAGKPLYNPIVGIASTPFVSGLGASPTRLGYLEVVADGGILTFGDASSSSATPGGQALAAGVVGAPGVGGTFSGQQP